MQNNEIAIQATHLGKCYHIYEKPEDRLKQIIARGNKQYYREFWALNDVSFTLHRGESLGIIGRNGSGKSTLLQMLCQTLTPTNGKIRVNGKIAALLELGAGFNPEFTGRENIYLNGAILGFSRREMDERFEDIIAFADIGNFIDQAVKTYSSGMFVRLAFSVQACVNPDILIVDEALSVGDIFFQQKCAKRMQELRAQGTTLIFVSHDMSIVRDLCQKSIYLKNGKLQFFGPSTDAIRLFMAEKQSHQVEHAAPPPTIVQQDGHSSQSGFIQTFKESACWTADEANPLIADARLVAVSVFDEQDVPILQTHMMGKMKFKVLYQVLSSRPIDITLVMRNRYDNIIHASGSYTKSLSRPHLQKDDYAIFEIDVMCMIEAGNYTFSVILSNTTDSPVNQGKVIDESPKLGPLTITWNYAEDKAPWFGMFGIPTTARIMNISEKI
ncbi:MAG: ABC transporter ATP-binding protein [Gammaproteobacteria bacterium]|nr:ABC transporter ATP-binding protein [Gammaproteobacteria bacterium]